MIALEYHDVIVGEDFDASGFPGGSAASYKLRARAFNAHLDAIAAEGRSVHLTFDDGGASFRDPIAGELEARGWRGQFFITTDYIGAPAFLDAPALCELHQRGHVIGSHSCSHPIRMAACTRSELLDEWKRSTDLLSDLLGSPVTVASVPGGYFSRAVAETAAEAGIRTLFTSEPTTRVTTVDGCAVIGRYTLRRDDPPARAAQLVRGGAGARAGQWLAWNGKKVVKAVAGPAYLRLRALLLGDR